MTWHNIDQFKILTMCNCVSIIISIHFFVTIDPFLGFKSVVSMLTVRCKKYPSCVKFFAALGLKLLLFLWHAMPSKPICIKVLSLCFCPEPSGIAKPLNCISTQLSLFYSRNKRYSYLLEHISALFISNRLWRC